MNERLENKRKELKKKEEELKDLEKIQGAELESQRKELGIENFDAKFIEKEKGKENINLFPIDQKIEEKIVRLFAKREEILKMSEVSYFLKYILIEETIEGIERRIALLKTSIEKGDLSSSDIKEFLNSVESISEKEEVKENPELVEKTKEEPEISENSAYNEDWTKEDEEVLNNLLQTIESAQKRIQEIDSELALLPGKQKEENNEEIKKTITETTSSIKDYEEKLKTLYAQEDALYNEDAVIQKKMNTLDENRRNLVKNLTEKEEKKKNIKGWFKGKDKKTLDSEIEKIKNDILTIENSISKELDNTSTVQEKILENYSQIKLKEEEKGKAKLKLKILKEKLEIEEDKKRQPFSYFLAEKSKNPLVEGEFKNKRTETLDLTWHKWEKTYCSIRFLNKTDKNEGYFEYSLSGFCMIIKNVEEIKRTDGINAMSDEAIYKIIGPDGLIVEDNIKGYNEACQIYKNKVEEYEKKMEEEFNNLNKK